MSLKVDYACPERICDICGNEIHDSYYDADLHFVELDLGERPLKPDYNHVYEVKHDDICQDCMLKLVNIVDSLRNNFEITINRNL